jgi:hypothetical protein
MHGYKTISKIVRQPCDKDCPRRINLDKVCVEVCANCDFLNVQEGNRLLHVPPAINCLKYIEESRRRRVKPLPFGRETRLQRKGAVTGWHYRDVK